MLRTQSIGFICFGFALILLTSTNLMAGTAPHLVAGTLENDEFTTWLGLQNRSGKTCTVGVQYHRGAMKLPVETLLTDGVDMGNFFTKELPSHGSTRIEVSTAPGTDTIFTGAASIFFDDSVCLNEVGITAEYRVKPASRVTAISELFSYPVGSATPLGQCTIARISYNPPSEIPAVATVSNGGVVLPAGTKRFMQVYDQDGVLVNSTTPTEYDGSHSAQNLPEVFPGQGAVSGIWKVCTEKPDDFDGTAAIDVLYINVVNEGNIQFAATSSQQINEDCKLDDTTMCLLNQQFGASLSLRDTPSGPSRLAKVGSFDGSSGTFIDEQASLKMTLSVQNGCASDFPAYWLIAASDTTVEYTLTVTDTSSDMTKTYQNELGQPSPAIVDTAAFATCP
jgi:hypothetical protein